MSSARRRAEGCFAKARSTTFLPEREAAIQLGIRIAEKAGLDLDQFDIPGRTKSRPSMDALFEGHGFLGDNFRYVVIDPSSMEAVFRAMEETIFRGGDVERERRRRMEERRERRLTDALNFLFARGVRMYRDGDNFTCPDHHDPAAVFKDSDVLNAAMSRGWRG